MHETSLLIFIIIFVLIKMKSATRIFLTLVFTFTMYGVSLCRDIYTTEGKDFYLSFMGLSDGVLSSPGTNTLELFVNIAGKRDCEVTITHTATGWEKTADVKAGKVTRIDIPSNLCYANATGDTVAIFKTGMRLSATDTISAYIGNYSPYSFDAACVLPLQSLGTDYRVACYNKSTEGIFEIVATDNNTEIEVTFSNPVTYNDVTYKSDTTYTFTINAGEVLFCAGDGMLGTRIKSVNCKKIAVFSGNYCPYVPDECAACDVLVEQIPPTNAWGSKFIVSPTINRKRDSRVIIQACKSETTIRLKYGHTMDSTVTIGENENVEIEIGNEQLYISANEPVAVTQYAIGGFCSGIGDPFMLWINPLEQSVEQVIFSPCPSTHINSHYIQIVTPSNSCYLTTLDGNDITKQFEVSTVNKEYSVAKIKVTSDPHIIKNPYGVMVYVYGYADGSSDLFSYESYGYYAGTAIKNIEDKIIVDDEVHQYNPNDKLVIKRIVKSDFDSIIWVLNGEPLKTEETEDDELTIIIPMNLLHEGTNTIEMIVVSRCGKQTTGSEFYFTTCPEIEIPRFFTPNDDGENDTWIVKNLECYQSAKVRIYDRYGKNLADYYSSYNQWDGKYNGTNMITDTYWYEISLPEIDKRLVGHFLLKR